MGMTLTAFVNAHVVPVAAEPFDGTLLVEDGRITALGPDVEAPDGAEVARGLVAYDAPDAVRIAGLRTAEIEAVLGHEARSAMVHRDDLVVTGAPGGEQGGRMSHADGA